MPIDHRRRIADPPLLGPGAPSADRPHPHREPVPAGHVPDIRDEQDRAGPAHGRRRPGGTDRAHRRHAQIAVDQDPVERHVEQVGDQHRQHCRNRPADALQEERGGDEQLQPGNAPADGGHHLAAAGRKLGASGPVRRRIVSPALADRQPGEARCRPRRAAPAARPRPPPRAGRGRSPRRRRPGCRAAGRRRSPPRTVDGASPIDW